jgi:START domain-containing protein
VSSVATSRVSRRLLPSDSASGGRLRRFGSVAVLGALISSASVSWAGERWEKIIDEDGIVVWQRDVAGTSIVEFKARARVNAPIIQVAAVLRNSGREQEWMESCVESRVLEWRSAIDATIYNRTASPVFFVSDRDLVAEAKTTIIPERRAVHVAFKSTSHKAAPKVDGVVRMPNVKGHWDLLRIDANATEVEYQIQADPGGDLPAWLVNWASQRIPFNTITAMRAQVKKPGYDNDVLILERAIDWSLLEPASKTAQADRRKRTPT